MLKYLCSHRFRLFNPLPTSVHLSSEERELGWETVCSTNPKISKRTWWRVGAPPLSPMNGAHPLWQVCKFCIFLLHSEAINSPFHALLWLLFLFLLYLKPPGKCNSSIAQRMSGQLTSFTSASEVMDLLRSGKVSSLFVTLEICKKKLKLHLTWSFP